MESNRRAVVGSYVRHHHGEGRLEPIDFSRLASATIRAVKTEMLHNPLVKLKYGEPIQFHN
eukprot:scaffold25965_cov57-Skeletonema_menzelii.AAC.1